MQPRSADSFTNRDVIDILSHLLDNPDHLVSRDHGQQAGLKLALNYVDADTRRDAGAPLGWLAIDPASVQARVQLAW